MIKNQRQRTMPDVIFVPIFLVYWQKKSFVCLQSLSTGDKQVCYNYTIPVYAYCLSSNIIGEWS